MDLRKTPFDDFILLLKREHPFIDRVARKAYYNLTPLGILCWKELQILRVIYKGLCGYSYDEFIKALGDISPRALTQDEELCMDDMPVIGAVNFFNFISNINQFFGALNQHYGVNTKSMPDYYNIKMFRNKVEEHWYDYIKDFIDTSGSIYHITGTQPIILTLSSEKNATNREVIKQDIVVEFLKRNHTVTLDYQCYDVSRNENYIKEIYNALELSKIPFAKSKKDEPLIKLIFDYGFPLPFSDVNAYCERLLEFMGDLELFIKKQ